MSVNVRHGSLGKERHTLNSKEIASVKVKPFTAGGADLGDPECDQMAERHLNIINRLDSSDRVIDMLTWVVLGSPLT